MNERKARAVVLIVDDTPENLYVYEEIIATHLPSCSTVTAANAESGLALARGTIIDAALVDVQMPGTTGIELCRKLKASEATRDIPVMLITAQDSSPSLKAEGLDAGADDFLSRPINNVELVARVKVLLRVRHAEEELRALAGRLEDLVEARTAALRESEARYRRLTENAQDMIWRTDPAGRLLYVNRAAEKMLGIPPAEAIGMSLEGNITPEAAAAQRALITEALAASPPRRHYQAEVEYRHRDGRLVPCEIRATLLLREDGEIEAIEGVSRDITERRKAEKARADLEEQFRQSQKMESVGRLAGGVAHDFNNLLTVILSACFFARERTDEKDPVLEEVAEIENAGHRAVGLTRQLLAFSRRQTLRPEVLDLNVVLQDVQRMLGRLIGEDISMTLVPSPDLWSVEADPGQIEQLVVNLVVNARDAMPDGGELIVRTANVQLDGERAEAAVGVPPGSYVTIAIRDTGTGMDDETRAMVFEPFFTTKGAGKGTGLGLSTVYGIVKQSGGDITVASEPGVGTTFTIYLPRTRGAPRPKTGARGGGPPGGGGETVLVVEDESAVRTLIVRMLEGRGYQVLEASEGLEARAVAEGHHGPIHLVLTDVLMPGPSGAETAKALLAARPQMRVLYMSGYTDDAIVRHGVLEPGTNFVEKPFTIDSLTRAVREVLDGGG